MPRYTPYGPQRRGFASSRRGPSNLNRGDYRMSAPSISDSGVNTGPSFSPMDYINRGGFTGGRGNEITGPGLQAEPSFTKGRRYNQGQPDVGYAGDWGPRRSWNPFASTPNFRGGPIAGGSYSDSPYDIGDILGERPAVPEDFLNRRMMFGRGGMNILSSGLGSSYRGPRTTAGPGPGQGGLWQFYNRLAGQNPMNQAFYA